MDQKSTIEIVTKYLDYLKDHNFNVRKAYIFGSCARCDYNENSDIDLAIVLKNIANSFTMQVELMKLSRKIDTRIEPHPFDEADFNATNPFANEILNYGIEII